MVWSAFVHSGMPGFSGLFLAQTLHVEDKASNAQ
jgi:hypothetical protein